jgi:hypothetical protein
MKDSENWGICTRVSQCKKDCAHKKYHMISAVYHNKVSGYSEYIGCGYHYDCQCTCQKSIKHTRKIKLQQINANFHPIS